MFDRSIFFANLRKRGSGVFGTRLTQNQVDGMTAILDEAVRRKLPLWYVALPLATAYHEVARTMQPITEYGNRRYFSKYDIGRLAKRLGNTPAADGDGFLYRGRGFVQITGRANYEKFGLALNPDKALELPTAVHMLFDGMIKGMFTGKELSDYNLGSVAGRTASRAIINGDVKKNGPMIAGYAEAFADALRTAGWGLWQQQPSPTLAPVPEPVFAPEKQVKPETQKPQTEIKSMTTTKRWWQSRSIWGAILTLVSFSGLFGISFDADTMTLHIQLDTLASQVLAGGIPSGAVLSWFGRLAAKKTIG
jgi:putative chitinase